MRLLIVEDEPSLARPLRQGLSEEGYAVDWVETVAEADEQIYHADYDLVILDLMLPDGTGLELLERWRGVSLTMPVLILTARDAVADKVAGLDGGGDDYLTKPFQLSELLARIRTLLRRRAAPSGGDLAFAELHFDPHARLASVDDQALDLTAKEAALFELFLSHPRRVLDRATIADRVWGSQASSNVIDVLIGRLRRKIRDAGGRPLLRTVKGLGYRLSEDGDPP